MSEIELFGDQNTVSIANVKKTILLVNNGNILFDLSILILQRFVSFLRSSPNPRKVFQSIVDKILTEAS
jgi:hypothetical protein